MHKTEIEVDEVRQNTQIDIEFKNSGYLQRESEELRHCRAVLVEEHVKDLVKQTWLEGLLSKDAHKVIVKAVDKVLNPFQPHHIPSMGVSHFLMYFGQNFKI